MDFWAGSVSRERNFVKEREKEISGVSQTDMGEAKL